MPVGDGHGDAEMLIRHRVSRIYFLRKFFDYPVSLKYRTFTNLGIVRTMKIAIDYLKICLFPRKSETTLEDFFINRFGMELYHTFFEDYTEKVWGVPCSKIGADWGAQRVKGVSIKALLLNAIEKALSRGKRNQKDVETSLIDRFLYPKHGPGELWEKVASEIEARGGIIHKNTRVIDFAQENGAITSIRVQENDGSIVEHRFDVVLSSMPMRDLITGMQGNVPDDVRKAADGLVYRDFMTVGLLVDRLKIGAVPDNWIYIQERDVKIGRLQVFNNWSPYLAKDSSKVWLGLEYFCNEGDAMWTMTDMEFSVFAAKELAHIGIINEEDVRDSIVIRVPKAYPAYFGTYKEIPTIRDYLDGISNLYLIGRNGQHRYNNMDHSMLTAMRAVDAIVGTGNRAAIWDVNTESQYHEKK